MASFWKNQPEMTGYNDHKNTLKNIISSVASGTPTKTKIEHADKLNSQNELEKAYGIYKDILSENSGHAEALFGIGIILKKQKKFDLAIQFLSKAVESNPGKTEVLLMRGRIFRLQGMPENAISDFTEVIKKHPNNYEALIARGITFGQINQLNAAINDFSLAISLNSNCASAFYNRGVVYEKLHQFNSAIEDYSIAIKHNPRDYKAYNNRGFARRETKCFDAALKDFEKSVEINPDFAEGYFNKSLTLLSVGNYEEGFKLYEHRWKTKHFQSQIRNFSQPLWLGKEDLKGKTILLHSEQGLGDSIQYCRYLSFFNQMGCKVLLEIEDPLHSLMQTFLPKNQIYSKGEQLGEFDYHCPLMSLPLALNKIVPFIPMQTPYFKISEEIESAWLKKLGKKTKPRVGICWQGNRSHHRDSLRSIPLDILSPLLHDRVQWVCLQQSLSNRENSIILSMPNVYDYSSELDDFHKTGGLLKCLDAVISVDTSIAHLAGALALPLQLLLCDAPDARWQMATKNCEWYPSATLHRQKMRNCWQPAIESAIKEIDEKKFMKSQ
jgi:tetratricopeptide (TPR) repeat protein